MGDICVSLPRVGELEDVPVPRPVRERDTNKQGQHARELGLHEMPDYGHAYDFETFMRRADYQHAWRFCDMRMPHPG